LKNISINKATQESEDTTVMERLMREGSLIICFLLSLFLLIALVSYSPADPGFTTTGSSEPVQNSIGIYGAWIADALSIFLAI